MSDEENVMENVEQHADEADNTDHSNKRRHDQEEETEVESKKKKVFVLPEIRAKNIEWELPSSELADFLQERCQNYLGEKELESFLETPTPKNINKPIKLDPFMKALLEKKGLNRAITLDEEQQKVHSRLFQIMGPLAAAWHGLQSVVRQEDDEEPDPEKILKNLTDSVVLLGQAINTMAYERRLSVLAELSDVKNAKRQLKDNQEDINKEQKFLFGEEFQKHIKTLAKAQDSAEKLFAKNSSGKKRSSSSSWTSSTNSRPFSGGSSNNYHHSRGGAQSYFTRGRGGVTWKRGKKNMSLQSTISTTSEIRLPKSKVSFYKTKVVSKAKGKPSRETKIFPRKLETDNIRSGYLRDRERLEITNNRQTLSREGAQTNPNVRGEKGGIGQRDSILDTEG